MSRQGLMDDCGYNGFEECPRYESCTNDFVAELLEPYDAESIEELVRNAYEKGINDCLDIVEKVQAECIKNDGCRNKCDEPKTCCNCLHCARWRKKDGIECHCDLTDKYLGYLQVMDEENDCKHWEKETKWDEQRKHDLELLDRVAEKIKIRLIDNLGLENATKYGNENSEQQENSYATVMKYEIADCVDDLLDDLAELKAEVR